MDCTHKNRAFMKLTHSKGFHKALVCQDCGKKLPHGTNHGCWWPKEDGDESLPELDPCLWDSKRIEENKKKAEQVRIERAKEWQQKHDQYEKYIQYDPEWQIRRQRVLVRAQSLCEACLLKPATQVHHVNYDSLYAEVLFDLRAVCSECHKRIHGIRFMDLIK